MNNVKMIYPADVGDVVEIISLEEAIELEKYRASLCNYEFISRQQVIDNILCCPCTTLTDEPVGKTIKPYKGEKQ